MKVLKRLGMPITSIVKVLTKRRNDLEHNYLLPSLEQMKADVETVELWIDKSNKYLRPSIVLLGLSVKSFGCSASEVTMENTFKTTFFVPGEIEFFWDAKKEVVTLSKGGVAIHKYYKDYNWNNLINIQIKSYLSNDNNWVIPSSIATRLYKAYEKWVSGKRGPSFMATKKFS